MSEAKILENDPLRSTETILRDEYYGQDKGRPIESPAAPAPEEQAAAVQETPHKRPKKPKPTHYKVVCISLYTQDIENLEATVAELKRRGHTKANKSQLIRQALRQLDIDKLPPPQQ